jgi:hypothetical protein
VSNLEKHPNEILVGDDDEVLGVEPRTVTILAP